EQEAREGMGRVGQARRDLEERGEGGAQHGQRIAEGGGAGAQMRWRSRRAAGGVRFRKSTMASLSAIPMRVIWMPAPCGRSEAFGMGGSFTQETRATAPKGGRSLRVSSRSTIWPTTRDRFVATNIPPTLRLATRSATPWMVQTTPSTKKRSLP